LLFLKTKTKSEGQNKMKCEKLAKYWDRVVKGLKSNK